MDEFNDQDQGGFFPLGFAQGMAEAMKKQRERAIDIAHQEVHDAIVASDEKTQETVKITGESITSQIEEIFTSRGLPENITKTKPLDYAMDIIYRKDIAEGLGCHPAEINVSVDRMAVHFINLIGKILDNEIPRLVDLGIFEKIGKDRRDREIMVENFIIRGLNRDIRKIIQGGKN